MNYGRKASSALSLEQVRGIVLAVDEAIRLEKSPNRLLTINWEEAGVEDWRAAQTQLFHRMAGWMRQPVHAVWTIEQGVAVGVHSHIVLHNPRGIRLKPHICRWIRTFGGNHCRTAVNITTISPGSGILGCVRYISKAATPAACKAFEIEHQNCGTISGKRAGWTESLGAAARRRRYGGGDLHLASLTSILVSGEIGRVELEKVLFSRSDQKRRDAWRRIHLNYRPDGRALKSMPHGSSRPPVDL